MKIRNEREFNLYSDKLRPSVKIPAKPRKAGINYTSFAIILGAFLWLLHATAPFLQALFSLI